MKTLLLYILTVSFSISIFAQYTLELNDVTFENGVITDFHNTTEKDIIIPASFNGEPVTGIGRYSFDFNELTSVESFILSLFIGMRLSM